MLFTLLYLTAKYCHRDSTLTNKASGKGALVSRTTFDSFVFDGASFDCVSLRPTAQRLTVQYLTAQRLTAFEPWRRPRMFAESRTTPKGHTAARCRLNIK